ncbi:MAG: bifunctional DNA primase/polymerase [Sphingomonadales bacterium]|nr:bifunctional DNA primase/polymerase [Sphingomonadales bacterium]
MTASFMAQLGSRLIANGYTILPIAPGTKSRADTSAVWVDYPEWNRHAERPTTEVEVATWSGWPDCGIGIVGGGVAAIDIDILSDRTLRCRSSSWHAPGSATRRHCGSGGPQAPARLSHPCAVPGHSSGTA